MRKRSLCKKWFLKNGMGSRKRHEVEPGKHRSRAAKCHTHSEGSSFTRLLRLTGLGKDGLLPRSLLREIERLFVFSHSLPLHTGIPVCVFEEGLALM